MKFTEILENLKKGEKVTREKWEKPDCTIDFIVYDQNKGNFLLFYKGNCYRFNFNDEDIVAEDWKIYKEPTKNWEPKEEEAKFVAKKLSIIKRLENLASNSLDWKGNDYKYFIFYDCKEEKVSVASDINDKYLPFSIYFRSKESCENAIKAIGERNLKIYYFDIKDNQ